MVTCDANYETGFDRTLRALEVVGYHPGISDVFSKYWGVVSGKLEDEDGGHDITYLLREEVSRRVKTRITVTDVARASPPALLIWDRDEVFAFELRKPP